MAERTVAVASASGLHARPASLFANAVGETGVPVKITTAGKPTVDASSMLMLMTLGVAHGQEVTIIAEGERAEQVIDELAAMLQRDLDAPEEG